MGFSYLGRAFKEWQNRSKDTVVVSCEQSTALDGALLVLPHSTAPLL